jgi:hypothetical protein
MGKNKHSKLSSFFSLNEWNNMSEYDKNRNYKILENYRVWNSLGKYLKKDNFSIFRYTA